MLSRTMSDALGRISETVETITERSQAAESVIVAAAARRLGIPAPDPVGFRPAAAAREPVDARMSRDYPRYSAG